MGDSKMGLHARLMSQALRKLTSSISKQIVLFFINQLREKIGVMFGNLRQQLVVMLSNSMPQFA